MSRLTLEQALTYAGNDVEDHVLISRALAEAVDFIVTRNISDFTHSSIKAIEPPEVSQHVPTP